LQNGCGRLSVMSEKHVDVATHCTISGTDMTPENAIAFGQHLVPSVSVRGIARNCARWEFTTSVTCQM
jgi:hypothetical protein